MNDSFGMSFEFFVLFMFIRGRWVVGPINWPDGRHRFPRLWVVCRYWRTSFNVRAMCNLFFTSCKLYSPTFGRTNITRGLRNATNESITVTIDVICLWQKNFKPESVSVLGHKAMSSTEPDCSEVLPVTAVVFSPQFSSCCER